MERILEFRGCGDVVRCGGVHDHFPAPRGIDFAGGKRGWFCDGFCVARCGDSLEFGSVGTANQLMQGRTGTSGVDWAQAVTIGKSLLLSPIFGFVLASGLFLFMKAVIRDKRLYEAPKGAEPPPFWIRAMLVFTCTGVSFFHGSNDGQKGMGLIMLILIGTVPTAYAVNHAVTYQQTQDFVAVSTQTADMLNHYVSPNAVIGDAREEVTDYIRTKQFTPNTMLALRQLVNGVGTEMAIFKELSKVPQDKVRNFRNDMYVVSEALRLMNKT